MSRTSGQAGLTLCLESLLGIGPAHHQAGGMGQPLLTSSNLYAIIAKALNMASVGPVMVTILSGQFPSEMLILAPLCSGSKTSPKPESNHRPAP